MNSGACGSSKRTLPDTTNSSTAHGPLEALSVHFSSLTGAQRICGVIQRYGPYTGCRARAASCSDAGVDRRVPMEEGLGPSGVSRGPYPGRRRAPIPRQPRATMLYRQIDSLCRHAFIRARVPLRRVAVSKLRASPNFFRLRSFTCRL